MNDLAVRNGGGDALAAIQPRATTPSLYHFDEMLKLAEAFAKSGFIKGARSPDAALALMLVCQAQGRHIGEAITRFHVIEGVPSVKADVMLAEFQANGGMCEWVETNGEVARALFSHPRFHPKPLPIAVTLKELVENGTAVTWDDKARAMVLKTNYKRSAPSMLRARVITQGVRAIDPGSLHGFHSPEEVADFVDVAEDLRSHLPPPPATPAIEAARAEAFGPELPGQPAGPDDRPYHQVVADVVKVGNDRLKETVREALGDVEFQSIVRPLAASEIHSQLVNRAIQLGHDSGDVPTKNTERIQRLTRVYKEHRGWVRSEILAYLELVEGEATAEIAKAVETRAAASSTADDDPSVEAIPASERTGKGKTSQGAPTREPGEEG